MSSEPTEPYTELSTPPGPMTTTSREVEPTKKTTKPRSKAKAKKKV
jgi:hypothetical protein